MRGDVSDDLSGVQQVTEVAEHTVPTIVKVRRELFARWRAWRLNRQLVKIFVHQVDDSFLHGGYLGHGGYEAYKRDREKAKHLEFPLKVHSAFLE